MAQQTLNASVTQGSIWPVVDDKHFNRNYSLHAPTRDEPDTPELGYKSSVVISSEGLVPTIKHNLVPLQTCVFNLSFKPTIVVIHCPFSYIAHFDHSCPCLGTFLANSLDLY